MRIGDSGHVWSQGCPDHIGEQERQGLQTLVVRHSTKQQIAIRARIVLLAAEGKSELEIVRELRTSRNMVRLWRRRWLDLQAIKLADLSVEERLEDLPRPEVPRWLTAAQICRIEAMVCEKPQQSGRPISEWTGREIADEIRKRRIVPSISCRHASRLPKREPPITSFPLLIDDRAR